MRAHPTACRLATRRGGISSRPFSPRGLSAPAAARCARICSHAAASRSRGRRRSTGMTASAARRRSHRCRKPSAGVGPRRPDAGLARRLAAAAAKVDAARGDLGPRPRLRSLRRLSGGLALRGRLHGEDRRAGRGAPRVAESRAQPVVVRRAPDRLLVVEPRREQDRRRARLRRDRGRAAPAGHDVEHLPRPVSRHDRLAAAGGRTPG